MKNRYKKISEGIRKDTTSGNYQAIKKIKGTKYSKTFEKLTEAREWRLTFMPTEEKALKRKITLKDLIDHYIENHLTRLATSTRLVRLDRLVFFQEIHSVEIERITPEFLSRYFLKKTDEAIKKNSKRMSFNNEIADLNALFGWYKEQFNYRFFNPIRKNLKSNSVIKKGNRQKEKMTSEEFNLFFNELPEVWRNVAIVQSRLAARISEVAGLQFESIDFGKNTVTIKDVVVWGRRKEFIELKNCPKTGEIRTCFMTPDLKEILLKQLHLRSSTSNYVFHKNGCPLSYRSIQYAYDSALKRAGLYGRFSGSHFVRHGIASVALEVCGTLDSVKSITGHTSLKQAAHYSGISAKLQERSIMEVERHLKEVQERVSNG